MLRLAFAILVVAGTTAVAASAPLQPRVASIDDQLRQANRDAAEAEAEQERLETAASAARDEVTRLRARQLAAAQAIAAAEAEISAADARTQLAKHRLELQRARLAAEQAPLSSLLGGLAVFARRPALAFLADSKSPEDLVRLRVLLASVTPAIQARTAALAGDVEAAGRLEKAADDAVSSLAQRRQELERRREAFAALEVKANEIANERGSEALGAGDVALATAEKAGQLQREESSTSASARLARELAELGPAPLGMPGKGTRAPFPYVLPANAAVVEGLGSVSPNGVRSRGITLATRNGARLVAPASGTILFSGPFRDYDGVIIIDHGNGWKSVLVNAGSRLSRGDTVRLGDPIGTALGRVEVELQRSGEAVSPALIAGSSRTVSNDGKGG